MVTILSNILYSFIISNTALLSCCEKWKKKKEKKKWSLVWPMQPLTTCNKQNQIPPRHHCSLHYNVPWSAIKKNLFPVAKMIDPPKCSHFYIQIVASKLDPHIHSKIFPTKIHLWFYTCLFLQSLMCAFTLHNHWRKIDFTYQIEHRH